MLPIFMCGPGPRAIHQNITIKRSGGFADFVTGLFGGFTGVMPGMYMPMGYRGPLGYVTPREQMQFNYYFQQMQAQQYQYAMMNQAQMNQYAYLNQQQQLQNQSSQQLMDGDNKKLSEIERLETYFGEKGYAFYKEDNGKYTALDKNGKLAAEGTYEEIREQLFEITEEEAEELDESNDIDKDNDIDEDEPPTQRSQGVPSGWYKSSADSYKYLKSVDTEAVNIASKKEGQSPARYFVGHFLLDKKYNGCLSMKQINNLTKELIYYNKDCFNTDGTFKEGFSTDLLVIPDSKWIAKYIIGHENISQVQLLAGAKRNHTSVGNTIYHRNIMAQLNCRETKAKDIYYNDTTKTHSYCYSVYDENGKETRVINISLPEVSYVYETGEWKDRSGHKHSRADLDRLASEKFEDIQSNAGQNKKDSTVPDNDDFSDNTVTFGDEDEY